MEWMSGRSILERDAERGMTRFRMLGANSQTLSKSPSSGQGV